MRAHDLRRACAALALLSCVASCGDDDETASSSTATPPGPQTWQDCQASDQTFLRRALLAVAGRRAWGAAELLAYEAHLKGLVDAGVDPKEARRAVVSTMFLDPSFRLHWSEALMDALEARRSEVIRTNFYVEIQAQSCYGNPSSIPLDGGELAQWVRDNPPTATEPPVANFTIGQLLNSALTLDDMSPLYRAHLFQLVAFPMPGANVSPLELERLRRLEIGETFEASYLNRNPVCMECHNQEFSVTEIHPAAGNFDRALFGDSAASSRDILEYRSVFRVDGVVTPEGERPWGWNGDKCGIFAVPVEPDPLGQVVSFGSVDPQNASIWALELALQRGFAKIAGEPDSWKSEPNPDPDAALAYLVSRKFVENVWAEIFGSGLTIAHHFPRTDAQRQLLEDLADSFIRSRFSLRELLLTIVEHPVFNLAGPSEGCGDAAAAIPPFFNPWVERDATTREQFNSSADLVHPLGARILLRDLHRSMGWTAPVAIPQGRDLRFQRSIGAFISRTERGFDGLDLQAQLSWEDAYARCEEEGTTDFIDQLVGLARATPGATVGDAVTALKDRLLNEGVRDAAEQAALEQLLGLPLTAPVPEDLESRLRTVCGAFIITPQFVLAGVDSFDAATPPNLTVSGAAFPDHCAEIERRLTAQGATPSAACIE